MSTLLIYLGRQQRFSFPEPSVPRLAQVVNLCVPIRIDADMNSCSSTREFNHRIVYGSRFFDLLHLPKSSITLHSPPAVLLPDACKPLLISLQ